VASRSGDEPKPSLHKYKQNFKLKTFPMTNKSRASPFLETAVGGSAFYSVTFLTYFLIQSSLKITSNVLKKNR
jgi:hypothetical protein